MSEKKSQFIKINEATDSQYVPLFGDGVDRAISIPDLFAQIKDETFKPDIYTTIAALQASNLEVDVDNPNWCRCEETEYRLYKITNAVPGINDIALNNGNTAEYQVEYRDTGFVTSIATTATGALAVFTDSTGQELDKSVVPTNTGKALIQAADGATVAFPRKNSDNTVTMRSASQYFDDIKQNATHGAAGVIKTADGTSTLAQVATDEAITPANLATLKASNAETLDGVDDTKYVTPENLQNKFANDGILTIATVADIPTTPMQAGQIFDLVEYYAGQGFGGGQLKAYAGSITPDNGITFNGPSGFYVERINISRITPEMYGRSTSSNAVDTTRAINKAVVYGAANGLPVEFEDINYPLDGNIDGTVDGATIPGQGRGGIQVKTKSHIIFSGQVFTQSASPYTAYSLINFSGASDFIVEGPAEFIGDMLIHPPTGGEFGMGLYICNAFDGRISDITVKNCWGDGCYVSDTDFTSLANGTATASKRITITNCTFDNNRRQGLSGINGQHITFNRCNFINTGRTLSTPLSAGVDLETDASPNRLGMQHWTFNDCLMDNNAGPSVQIFPTLNNGLHGCYNIEFNNCVMTNTGSAGSFWSDRSNAYVRDIRVNGGYIGGGVYGGNETTFNKVVISRAMTDLGVATYAIETVANTTNAIFNNCEIRAEGDTTVNSKKLLFVPAGLSDEGKTTFFKSRFIAKNTYGGATNILLITRSPLLFTECEFTTEGTAPANYVGFDTTAGNARVGLPIYAMLDSCYFSSNWHIGLAQMQGRVSNLPPLKIRSVTFSGSNNIQIASSADIFEFNYNAGGASNINAPTDPFTGKVITVKVKNTSGGAIGVITWNAVFKMSAFTNPANGFSRSVIFYYDGTNWIETHRTTADVPN